MKTIDLAEKNSDDHAMPVEETSGGDSTWYPSIYVSDNEALTDIPEEGTAEIKYRLKRVTETKTLENGEKKESCSCEIEILSITPKAGSEKSEKSSDDAIEEGLEEAEE